MFALLLYLQEGLAFKNRVWGTEDPVDVRVTVWYCLTKS